MEQNDTAKERQEKDRAIIKQYFADNPADMEGVRRATFAYHLNHRDRDAHYFSGSWRTAECRWCDRTREEVRWDGLPPQCTRRPQWADESIESVIAREEALFEKVLARARKLASEIDIASLTGESLAVLHHTHGVDPTMLETALMEAGKPPLAQECHDAYQRVMAVERARSKAAQQKIVITVNPDAMAT